MPPYPALPGRPRTTGRLARGPELAASLAARLTARDRWLLRMLHEHRVLTTTQITQLAFGTPRAATARLLALYQLRAIDRFRPLAPAGSAPLHWVLDEAGAAVLAAEDGITVAEFGYRRDRALAIALSPQLAHTAGTNSVFCALAAQGRQAGDAALTCWWSERRCAGVWGDLARPDGYGRWTQHSPGAAPAARPASSARSTTFTPSSLIFPLNCGMVTMVSIPLSAIMCAISRSLSRKLIGTTLLPASSVP